MAGTKERTWHPSIWGRWLARSPPWTLTLETEALVLRRQPQGCLRVRLESPLPLVLERGRRFSRVVLEADSGERIVVGGLPTRQGEALCAAAETALAERVARREREARRAALLEWHDRVDGFLTASRKSARWIPREAVTALLGRFPRDSARGLEREELRAGASCTGGDGHEAVREARARGAIALWRTGLVVEVRRLNAAHVRREIAWLEREGRWSGYRALTEEQARAVVCFDGRVLVVAAAGSGKTSTMVAKALYAIERGLVEPEAVLMLAFNRSAAAELRTRTRRAVREIGRTDAFPDASSFHALGLALDAKASGRKKRVAPWLGNDAALEKLAALLETITRERPELGVRWHLLRALDAARDGSSETPPEARERDEPLLTLRGERLDDVEALAIADWLHLHGIDYVYARPDSHVSPAAGRAPEHPTFHYPAIALTHEHLPREADGWPSGGERSAGDADESRRRPVPHASERDARLVTHSQALLSGALFDELARALRARGLAPRLDATRATVRRETLEETGRALLARLRAFLRHVKSEGLSAAVLERRLETLHGGTPPEHARGFLEIALALGRAWDDALARAGCVDFEDMLVLGARALESGAALRPWSLVMVDEFQDVSPARRRMLRALVEGRGRALLAVGDDWQSIYRFAGAERSVMQRFADAFGTATCLRLERTFRFPQALADASSTFVQRNGAQLAKRVRSEVPARGSVLHAIELASAEAVVGALDEWLARLAGAARAKSGVRAGRGARPSVLVLVRHVRELERVPAECLERHARDLAITASTIHRVKGGEADHVLLPVAIAGALPSNARDDPMMRLVLPEAERFPDAEERRVFYVALTRARRDVTLFTVAGAHSPFLRELVRDGALRLHDRAGRVIASGACPGCRDGLLGPRVGRHGAFLGCDRFLRCRFTRRQACVPAGARGGTRSRGRSRR